MKKKGIVVLVLALALALVFGGCKKEEAVTGDPVFTLDSKEGIITVVGDGASQGTGGVGYLTFGKGSLLSYNLSGEDSSEVLRVVVFYKEEPEDPISYSHPEDSEKVYMDFTVENGTSGQIEMEAGEYALLIEVDSAKFSGTATFSAVDVL